MCGANAPNTAFEAFDPLGMWSWGSAEMTKKPTVDGKWWWECVSAVTGEKMKGHSVGDQEIDAVKGSGVDRMSLKKWMSSYLLLKESFSSQRPRCIVVPLEYDFRNSVVCQQWPKTHFQPKRCLHWSLFILLRLLRHINKFTDWIGYDMGWYYFWNSFSLLC